MTRLNLKNSKKILLICQAITNKHLLRFTYNGKPRLVEPYVIGQHATTGNYLVRGWERTETGLDQQRKLFCISRIEEITVDDLVFQPRERQFSQTDQHISQPTCQVNTSATAPLQKARVAPSLTMTGLGSR